MQKPKVEGKAITQKEGFLVISFHNFYLLHNTNINYVNLLNVPSEPVSVLVESNIQSVLEFE
jgi:hypothetical protein